MSAKHPASGTKTRNLTTAALLAALLMASAWIAIPAGAVPVTLQVFLVVLAALLLDSLWAATAVGLYVALGAAGLPVFAGGKGGIGVVAGPTGGYLIGFLVGATVAAAVRRFLVDRGVRPAAADAAAAVLVVAVSYAIGTVQLAFVLDVGPAKAIALGVVPFIAADVAKGVAAIVVAKAVRRAVSV